MWPISCPTLANSSQGRRRMAETNGDVAPMTKHIPKPAGLPSSGMWRVKMQALGPPRRSTFGRCHRTSGWPRWRQVACPPLRGLGEAMTHMARRGLGILVPLHDLDPSASGCSRSPNGVENWKGAARTRRISPHA